MKTIHALLCLIFLQASLYAQLGPGDIRSAGSNYSEYLFRTLKESTESTNRKGKVIDAFNNTENTVGKRFLFDQWVRGDSMISQGAAYTDSRSFLFNFDKMSGHVLVSADKINILAISPLVVNSLVLEEGSKKYRLERVDEVDSSRFFVALVKNNGKRMLYKDLRTRFTRANFRDDGMMQSGSRDDEYKDDYRYYLVDKKNNMFRLINFKPKVIKALLVADKEETEEYFRKHRNESIDEAFLTGLVEFINRS